MNKLECTIILLKIKYFRTFNVIQIMKGICNKCISKNPNCNVIFVQMLPSDQTFQWCKEHFNAPG